MKQLFIVFLFLLPAAAEAQPVLTSSNEASLGSSFTYVYVDPAGIQPGSSGANQTWDFSSATPTGIVSVQNWIAVSGTPYAGSFPGSNLVQQVIDTATVYLYHAASSSSTELRGIAFDAGGTPSIMTYSNPEILRQYPINYNSMFSDTYAGLLMLSLGPVTINIYRYGSYNYVADAYGTLITPAGSFSNTLRGRIRQVFTDSLVYVGVPLPAQVTQNYSTSYFWSCANPGNKLYQFYIGNDTTVAQAGTTITKSVSYQGTTTSVEEQIPSESATAAAFPNPASDLVSVVLDNTPAAIARLMLYDMKGNPVKNMSARLKAAGRFEWMFSMAGLPAGVYHARVTCTDRQWQTKLVKE